MKSLFALFLSLALSSCSYITTLRTEEIRSVETNLEQRVDSLGLKLESLSTFVSMQLRMQNADMNLSQKKTHANLDAIMVKMEELNFALSKLDKDLKEMSIKVSQVQPSRNTKAPAEPTIDTLKIKKLEYATARSDYLQGQYKEAFQGFKDVYASRINSELSENSLYWMALSYEKLSFLDNAIKALDRLKKEFPKGIKICTSLNQKARMLETKGAPKGDVLLVLNELIEHPSCASSNEAALARDRVKED
jgi:TolA-binding protein